MTRNYKLIRGLRTRTLSFSANSISLCLSFLYSRTKHFAICRRFLIVSQFVCVCVFFFSFPFPLCNGLDQRHYHWSGITTHRPDGILQRTWANWCATVWTQWAARWDVQSSGHNAHSAQRHCYKSPEASNSISSKHGCVERRAIDGGNRIKTDFLNNKTTIDHSNGFECLKLRINVNVNEK